MGKPKTIDAFFKKKDVSHSEVNTPPPATNIDTSIPEERPSKCPRIQPKEIDTTSLERDPGLRPQICEFPINLQDEIQRAYIKAGPYQPVLDYPFKESVYCLPCYLFGKKPTGRPGSDAFTVKGFDNWKKVNDGMNCPLIGHVGKDPNSPHKIAVKCYEDLMKHSRHVDKLFEKQSSKEIQDNRLRLKASIDSVQWLALQGCAFRGHDESLDSINRGNFVELVKLVSTYDHRVAGVVLENAPRNAKYTSPTIQKEILHIIASKVQDAIREEIGDAKFCIIIDEARDESKKEQMAIILRLQLALVSASREAKPVHQFFNHLTPIINIVVGSSKRNDELQATQAEQIENMIASNEIETGRGLNQSCTLQRAGDTRWGSHFQSISSLIKMFDATCSVLYTISKEGANYQQRGDAEGAYKNLRENGWEKLLASVTSFCELCEFDIDIPDMNARYTKVRGRSRHENEEDLTTIEHHFRIDIFTVAIDFQLQELNTRFSEHTVELLNLSSALNPKNAYKSFNIDNICKLVEKFYPQDFTEQEKTLLRFQLQHYEFDVPKHPDFQNMDTISELCRGLASSGKSKIYHLVDRLIRLVLTLPVSTATTERAFSAMKHVKTRLRNRMEDEFLADNLVVYIEKEIAKNFTVEMIMDEFYSMKDRRRA
uniref:TTF-type domain-containing protein n=1 Tax=Fagus sylvatica TaxID=28930 RepID=A0A2N9HM17_FAGSY